MKYAIWKFEAPIDNRIEIEIPEPGTILSVQVQRDIPCIWALCDTEAGAKKRKFYWVGTGHTYSATFFANKKYIATVQFPGLVFHLFEEAATVKVECKVCKGVGQRNNDDCDDCNFCGGTGYIER